MVAVTDGFDPAAYKAGQEAAGQCRCVVPT